MRCSSRLRTAWLLPLLLCLLPAPPTPWRVEGFSLGAPDSACSSMIPSHASTPAQTSPAPFQIIPGGASVDGGQKVSVTLSTVSPTGNFKGFLLQARDANTSQPVGTFVTDSYKSLTCGQGFNNAVTHASPAAKVSAVLEWAAPANWEGEVAFRATAVQDYSTFWTGITSEKVTVKRSAASAPALPTTAPPAVQPETTTPPDSASSSAAPAAAPAVVVEETGGVEEEEEATTGGAGGAQAPAGGRKRGGLLSSFRKNNRPAPTTALPTTTAATTPGRVRIAGAAGSQGLAGALSSIYLGCSVNKGCFGIPAGCDNDCNSLFTYTRTSDGYQFEIMGTVEAGANAYVAGGLSFDDEMGEDSVMACRSFDGIADITMSWNPSGTSPNTFLSDPKEGLSQYEMKQIDGKLYCRFTRQARMEIQNKVFDLDEDTFHLMLAEGPLAANGYLTYHKARVVSAKATSMAAFETLGSSSELFVVLHACFMVAAWVGAASSGILLARYFKQTWKNYKACNIDQWFHFHRLFMIITWGLTVAGFVLIVIHLKGWTSIPADHNPHAYIGIVSIALCFIQPFMAMLRCGPTHPRRPVFNWLHWFVGNAAQTLGITAIFFGLELYNMPRWTWWIMIVFVGFHCLVHIILSIGECVSDSKAKNQVSGIPMKEYNSSRDMLTPPQDKVLDAPGGTFRKAMLAMYLIVIWLVVAILLLVITVKEDQLRDWNLLFWE